MDCCPDLRGDLIGLGVYPNRETLFSTWLAGPPNVSTFTNDVGYLTAEADPIFSAWLAVPPNVSVFTNDSGYLAVEADPVFTAWLAVPPNVSIFTNDSGYLTAETDPIFAAWLAVPPDVSIFTNDSGYLTTQHWTRAGTILSPTTAGDSLTVDGAFLLETAVWKDINMAGYLLTRPAVSAPTVETFRSSGGVNTTIETYAFALNEKVHGGFELQHDYKEGTDLIFHVHWQGIALPAGGADNVQWRITYIVARDGTTLSAATTIDSPDVVIDTQYGCYRTDFGAIDGTTFLIGDQFMFTLTRVAAVSDDYAGVCLIETAGIHYKVDSVGSRTILGS